MQKSLPGSSHLSRVYGIWLHRILELKRRDSAPKKLEPAQIVFGNLGELDDDQSDDFTEVDKFRCKMCHKKDF